MSPSRLVFSLVFGVLATGWVAVDADRRGRNWLAWAILVALSGVFGFVTWLIVRRRTPVQPGPVTVRRRVLQVLAAGSLVIAGIMITIFTTTFLLQVARVEGGAMSPTLNDQDRLIVNKLAFQLRDPRRGELVMLHYPLNPDRKFLKRIVAEEGDQVRIIDGHVHLNDVRLDEAFVTADTRSHDDWGPQVVPQGYYFVLGDRRNNSSDSRHWGFVPKKYVVGRVQCRWWPVRAARCF
jgi:signal peptidase I